MMLKMQSDLKDAKAIEDKAKAAEESLRKAIDLKEKLDATASSSVTTTSTAQLASSSTMAKAQVNMDTEMAITRTLIEGAGTIETQVVDEEESTPLQREETANPTEDANGTSTKKRKHAPPDFDGSVTNLGGQNGGDNTESDLPPQNGTGSHTPSEESVVGGGGNRELRGTEDELLIEII